MAVDLKLMKDNALLILKDIHLLKRLGISLLMLSLTRLIFLISNYNAFNGIGFSEFIGGIWIDLITIGICFIPFYTLSLLPLPFYPKKWYQLILKSIFHITNTVLIALNLIDVEYFKYTAKRSTADLFSMAENANDIGSLISSFVVDFWWLIVIFILLIFLSNWLYNKTRVREESSPHILLNILNFVVLVSILLVIGRGGFGYRPADMLTAAEFTSPQNTALVSNTPLSILKTLDKAPVKEKDYFPENSPNIYTPIYKASTQHQIRKQPNVMVVILESFGNEWIGKKNHKNYTPFFDSLLDQSLYFENGFANGKKSIEAVPSIFASIPSLMDNPYISSRYGTNKIEALPELLKEMGYSSAFYHGATNGSMKFDVFAANLGFQKYFGRSEFNDEDKCDPTWGVLDEYFLPWTARSITKQLKEPFLAGLFTLSSHHPYFVPKEYRDQLPKGDEPMAQSIAYTDMSLRLFFQEAKKQPWYKNTIFILVADHTPAGTASRYKQHASLYRVPIAIFDPQKEIKPHVSHKIFSQIDIMPTVLDLVGYSKDIYCFGNSYYSDKVPFSVNYIGNSHLYFQGDYMLNFLEDKTTGLYNYKIDTLMYYDSISEYPQLKNEMETKMKGVIQRYNHDLIYNKMTLP